MKSTNTEFSLGWMVSAVKVGLIEETWTSRYPPELAARLPLLIDAPDG